MSTPCDPWCKTPPDAFPGQWTCPVCGRRWYVEEHVERMIEWCREHVEPTMTEPQLDFLRAFMCGQASVRGMHPDVRVNGNPNRGLL